MKSLAVGHRDDLELETISCNRYKWRRTMQESTKIFQEQAIIWANGKRAAGQGQIIDRTIDQFTFDECITLCLCDTSVSHKKSHIIISSTLEITIYLWIYGLV